MATRHTRQLVGVGVAVVTVVLVAGLWLASRVAVPGVSAKAQTDPTLSGAAPGSPGSSARTGESADTPSKATAELERLRAQPVVGASSTTRISGDATLQPDLYAAEFVRRLLTQDYRTARPDLLAWAQAESAQSAEPLVVGLVPPELRDRLAAYSVTDTARGPAPIPTEREWAALAAAGATQTVQVEAVRIPLAWSNAVAAGRITDPGVTGREVAATVTRHTGSSVTRWSVALTLNLEGPPTRATWGFVTAVTYRVVQIGAGS